MLKTDHIVFPVWDAQASLDFYRGVMGFALVECVSGDDWGGKPWLMMIFSPGDGREIVLVSLRGQPRPRREALPRDVRHIAFAEPSLGALDKWRKKLRANKIEFWEENHGPQYSIYFEDPNGMILEVTAPPSRARKTTKRAAFAAAERWIAAN
jgi:catechol 2,3-dioxygenase-like lactoylglutathione lyase family enzyme